MYVC
jgi:hypothetical protein